MLIFWLFVVLITRFAGCNLVMSPSEPELIEVPRGVIFSASLAAQQESFQYMVDQGFAQGYWTPTSEQVTELEATVATYLESLGVERFAMSDVWTRLDQYHRQYAGIVFGGEAIIYINFYCQDYAVDEYSRFIELPDNRECGFGVWYNTTTQRFFDYSIPERYENPAQTFIFTAGQAESTELRSLFSGQRGNFWTPTGSEIAALEAALPAYLAAHDADHFQDAGVWQRLDTYGRQYAGLIMGDQRLIYGNFFCNDLGINLAQTWVAVDDGGACFFVVMYDPAQNIFTQLSVNGVA